MTDPPRAGRQPGTGALSARWALCLVLSVPLSLTAGCVGRGVSCPPCFESRIGFFTEDSLLSGEIEKLGWGFLEPAPEQIAVRIQSKSTIHYARKPNWWAFLAIPIGYYPLSFRAVVDYRLYCDIAWNRHTARMETSGRKSAYALGIVPDPHLPDIDAHFAALRSEARREAARQMALAIAEWLADLKQDIDAGNESH